MVINRQTFVRDIYKITAGNALFSNFCFSVRVQNAYVMAVYYEGKLKNKFPLSTVVRVVYESQKIE